MPDPKNTRPPKRRTAAQRASDANKLKQYAVRNNTRRPGDMRTAETPDSSADEAGENAGLPPGWDSKG